MEPGLITSAPPNMELLESVEVLNERLLKFFGRFDDALPHWRVVWSNDQQEFRILRTGEVAQLVPKYWFRDRYVLEKLLPVPELNRNELISKTSYEPVWVFETNLGHPLPPKWEAIEIIIRTVQENAARAYNKVMYKDPDSVPEEAFENRKKRIEKLELDLFGNETAVGTALSHKTGVTVPQMDNGEVK